MSFILKRARILILQCLYYKRLGLNKCKITLLHSSSNWLLQKAAGSVPVKNSPVPYLLLPTTTIISFSSGVILTQHASLLFVAVLACVLNNLKSSNERTLFSLSNHGSATTT